MEKPIEIMMEDTLLHQLPNKPFCRNLTCPCHADLELLGEYVLPAIERGVTYDQAKSIWRGELAPDFDLAQIDQGLLSRVETHKMRSIDYEVTDPDMPAR